MGLLGTIGEIGGAIVGGLTGGPAGAVAGASLGGSLGTALDGPPKINGGGSFAFESPFDAAPGEASPYTNAGGMAAIASYDKYAHSTMLNTSSMSPQQKIRAHGVATQILGSVGVSNTPKAGSSPIGADFGGQPVYSSDALKNSTDISLGGTAVNKTGVLFGSVGAFANVAEAGSFGDIGKKASDPEYIKQLDNLKSKDDSAGFANALTSATDSPVAGTDTHYAAYKVFENWNLLSPTQKSAAVAAVGVHGYKFADGAGVIDKVVTQPIPNTHELNLGNVADLSGQGVNVAPAVHKWDQLTAIQDTFYKTSDGAATAKNLAAMGMLGYGQTGQAVPTTEQQIAQGQGTPEPHYGVGAVSVPRGSGILSGYVKTASIDNKDILIPNSNRTTSIIQSPVVATAGAAAVYNQWPEQGRPITRGVVGGSALVGNLHAMAEMNPYSLGAVMVHDAYQGQDVANNKPSDLSTVARLMAVTFNRLKDGSSSAATNDKDSGVNLDHPVTPKTFAELQKAIRGGYAQEGISSKEIGYQLANQAYAEGRLNDTQLVSAQKSLDMIYNTDGYDTAQKLLTGKDRGFQIVEARRG